MWTALREGRKEDQEWDPTGSAVSRRRKQAGVTTEEARFRGNVSIFHLVELRHLSNTDTAGYMHRD